MAEVIALVVAVQGEVIARAPDGSERVLAVGDEVFENEIILTGDGARITLDSLDGQPFVVEADQEILMSRELASRETSAEDESVVTDAAVAQVIEALESGEDLLEVLDPAAAGPGGADGGGGRSFVQLARIVELTGDLVFAFPQNAAGFVAPDELLPRAEEAGESPAVTPPAPPVTPEPPPVVPAPTVSMGFDLSAAGFVNGAGGAVSVLLAGTAENAVSVFVTIDVDGTPVVVPAQLADDGTWFVSSGDVLDSVSAAGLILVSGVVYTATATATGADGSTANVSDTAGFVLPGAEIDLFVVESVNNVPSQVLEGSSSGAISVSVVITGSDGSSQVFAGDAVTLNADGTWSADLSGGSFTDGVTYTATVTAADTSGNTATDEASDGHVLPAVEVETFVVASVDNVQNLELSGSSSNATGISLRIEGPDGTFQDVAADDITLNADGSWSADLGNLTFADGVTYTVTATATDAQNNTATDTANDGYVLPTVDIDNFVVESVDDVLGAQIDGQSTNAASITLVVNGSDDSSQSFTGDAVTLNADGTWSVDLSGGHFVDGVSYTATATATDLSGNTATDTATGGFALPTIAIDEFTVDSVADEQVLKLEGSSTDADSISVVVTGSDDSSQTFSGTAVTLNADGTWSVDLSGGTFTDGVTYTATATVTDTSGNTATDAASDGHVLPAVEVETFVVASVDNVQNLELSGSSSNATGISLRIEGPDGVFQDVAADDISLNGDGTWSADLGNLSFSDGVSYTVTATATDAQSNTATDTATDGYVLPTVDIDNFNVASVDDVIKADIDGQSSNGDSIKVVIIGSDGSSQTFDGDAITLNGDGSWSADLSGGTFVEDVSYTATVTVTDEQGNTDTDTATSGFTLPDILGLEDTGDVVVDEQFLSRGTGAGQGLPVGSGSFIILALVGLTSLSVFGKDGETVITYEQLSNLPEGGVTVVTDKGVLTITGMQPVAGEDGQFEVFYGYELSEAFEHDAGDGRNIAEKDGIQLKVTDANGNTATNIVNVTIIDDVPEIQSLQNIILAAGEAGSVDGQFDFLAGADELAELRLDGVPPDGLIYTIYRAGDDLPDGLDIAIPEGGVLLVATADNGGAQGEVSFTLLVNPDGGYVFDLVTPEVRSVTTTELSDLPNASRAFYSLKDGEWTGARIDGAEVIISGNANVNPSGQGIGIGNNQFGAGNVIRFELADAVSTFGLSSVRGTGSGDRLVIEWTAYATNEHGVVEAIYTSHVLLNQAGLDLSFQIPDGNPDGVQFDRIELRGVSSSEGQFEVDNADGLFSSQSGANYTFASIEYGTVTNIEGSELSFDLIIVDGDGDEASESFQVKLVGDEGTAGYLLTGSDSADVLLGSSEDDILIGGAGNDILTGGAGDDIFVWRDGDQGPAGDPALDIVTDFDNGNNTLHLADLLDGGNETNLDAYIHAVNDGADTILKISSEGGFAGGFDATAVDQKIVLQGQSEQFAGLDSGQIIAQLLDDSKLVVDS